MKLFDGVWKVEFICLKNQRTNSGLKQSKRFRYLWACTERPCNTDTEQNFWDLHCALLQLSPIHIHSRFGQLSNMCCSTAQGQTDVWLPVCNQRPFRLPPYIHWHSHVATWRLSVHESWVALPVFKWQKALWHITLSRELGSWYLPWQTFPFQQEVSQTFFCPWSMLFFFNCHTNHKRE